MKVFYIEKVMKQPHKLCSLCHFIKRESFARPGTYNKNIWCNCTSVKKIRCCRIGNATSFRQRPNAVEVNKFDLSPYGVQQCTKPMKFDDSLGAEFSRCVEDPWWTSAVICSCVGLLSLWNARLAYIQNLVLVFMMSFFDIFPFPFSILFVISISTECFFYCNVT